MSVYDLALRELRARFAAASALPAIDHKRVAIAARDWVAREYGIRGAMRSVLLVEALA